LFLFSAISGNKCAKIIIVGQYFYSGSNYRRRCSGMFFLEHSESHILHIANAIGAYNSWL